MARQFLVLTFLFALNCCYTQVDSLAKPEFTRLNNFLFGEQETHLKKDTLIDGHFNYFAKDFNGSLAQPSQDLIIQNTKPDELGLRFFKPNYRSHILQESDVLFHQTVKPYTRVFALAGMRQEQILKLLHTRNIKRVNYTVIFNRYKAVGFYKNQLGTVDNFISTLNYKNASERYQLNFWFLFNKLKHKENGGLSSISSFDELYRENKELFQVNLQSAKRITRNLNTGLFQFFKIGRSKDSINSKIRLFHKLKFSSDYSVFNDESPASGFFPLIIRDS
ncbi:MAG: putative porin, partial [Bacteroidota bacterium]